MKKILIPATAFLALSFLANAQNTILEARGKAVGTVVTVKGIATNGSELGIIRYMQDGTAGIAAYGATLNPVLRGDSITVTGTIKNYNQLIELDPLTTVVVRSTGNPLPAPIALTPGQLTEPYESMLVKVSNVIFADAGGVFTQKKYLFTANGESGYIYVKSSQTDIVGQPIPSGLVSITGVLSQFDYASPTAGYQLLPRTISDIHMTSSIYLTNTLTNTSFTKSDLSFTWNTNVAGSTEMFYGLTAETVKANKSVGTGGSTSHSISLSGLEAGQITWAQGFSVNGSDTAFSAIMPFATISNSSGKIITYFNTPVDVSYSTGVDAVYLSRAIDDTLISYINRAKYSIDLTMYNFNNTGITNVSNALKAAANRGVVVRVIGCGTTNNFGIDELAGSAVKVLIGPATGARTGIMHNKFILFDTESANPAEPLVWTGSTNLTDDQINKDANNVIIIQDQSLARGYKIEFEEMWGSHGAVADAAKAKFGFNKKNNTPHEYVINGKRVESYFSPTDGVNAKIVNVVNTANHDLSIAIMVLTRTEIANPIVARKNAGVAVNMISNSEGENALVNPILQPGLGTHYTFDNVSPGIMHNKYMIVDQAATSSDPIVLTGSHNWSSAADNDNDENTLVIHDATLANIYYQNFVKRFVDNNGVLFELSGPPVAVNDTVKTMVDELVTVTVLDNDKIESSVTVSIESPAAKHGDAYIPFSDPNVISYMPYAGFEGKDTITYKIVYTASPALTSTGKIFVTVSNSVGLSEVSAGNRIKVYPNPVQNGNVTVGCYIPKADKGILQLMDITGKIISESQIKLTTGENVLKYHFPGVKQGTYVLRIKTSDNVWNQKLMFE